MGSPQDLTAALRIIEEEGPSVGLHLNRGKSLLFIPAAADSTQSTLPSEIPITRNGFSLLGCLIGLPSFCEEVFHKRVSKVRPCMGALKDLNDSQLECTLLRSCLTLPKVSFVLRTCTPSHIYQSAMDFDTSVRETLESIVGGPLPDWSWLKATLPNTFGGLGLRSALQHAPAAFLRSCARSQPLVVEMLNHSIDSPSHISPTVISAELRPHRPDWQHLDDIDVPLRQNSLSFAIDTATHQDLLSSSTCVNLRVVPACK